jgi:hypothetical protein
LHKFLLLDGPVDLCKILLGKVVDVSVDVLDDEGGVDSWSWGDDSVSTFALGEAVVVVPVASGKALGVASELRSNSLGRVDEVLLDGLLSDLVGSLSLLEFNLGEAPNLLVGVGNVLNSSVILGLSSLLLSWGVVFPTEAASSGLGASISSVGVSHVSALEDPGVEAESSLLLVAGSIDGNGIVEHNVKLYPALEALSEVDVLRGLERGIGVHEVIQALLFISFLCSAHSHTRCLDIVDSGFNLGLVDIELWDLEIASGGKTEKSGDGVLHL